MVISSLLSRYERFLGPLCEVFEGHGSVDLLDPSDLRVAMPQRPAPATGLGMCDCDSAAVFELKLERADRAHEKCQRSSISTSSVLCRGLRAAARVGSLGQSMLRSSGQARLTPSPIDLG